MGIPTDKEAFFCPYDNACFPTGRCPYWAVVTITAVETSDPEYSPLPNGTVRLPQVSSNIWGANIGDWSYTLSMSGGFASLVVRLGGGQIAFTGYHAGTCLRSLDNNAYYPAYSWYSGWAFWSFSSDEADAGTFQADLQSLNLRPGPKIFAEQYAIPGGGVVRFADKTNGTKIYMKKITI